MRGRRVTLEVDGVQVLEHNDTAAPQGQLGLYAWGRSRVEFRAASVTEDAGQRRAINWKTFWSSFELKPGVWGFRLDLKKLLKMR
jgi:hypothetical protein